jgi:signal peptidase II
MYGVAAATYTLDRVTKVLAEELLQSRPPVEVIPAVLQFRFTTNPGGAFGLFGSVPALFVAISVLVVLAVVMASRDLPSTGSAVGLGLVLAGALGNLTDRAVRGPRFSGEVVDFIDFHVWPVFNLADSALVLGAVVLVIASIRRDRAVRRHPSAR